MFSLFFTTPADQRQGNTKGQRDKTPSRDHLPFTWSLVVLWSILVSFGAISVVNPKWLQDLSRSGAKVESRWYRDYGDNYLRDGKYRLAIAQYQRALEIKPDNVAAIINQAIAYSRAGYGDRAEKILKDALKIETYQKGVIYYNLAEMLEKQGKEDEAIHYYRQAIDFELEPDFIYRKLGTLYLGAEQYEEAQEAFQMALASQVDLASSYQNMLRNSIAVFEDDTTNLRIIKEQLAQNIRTEDLTDYDPEVIRLMEQRDPRIAKIHNLLGFTCARLGDIDGAIEHFEQSLQIWPGNRDAKKNLQVAYQLKQKQQNLMSTE